MIKVINEDINASVQGYTKRVIDIMNQLNSNKEFSKWVENSKIELSDMLDDNVRDRIVQIVAHKFLNRKGRVACFTYATVTNAVLKLLGEHPETYVGTDREGEFSKDFANHVWTKCRGQVLDYPENRDDDDSLNIEKAQVGI